jgi:hypothetical protein
MGIKRFYIPCQKLKPTETTNSRLIPVTTYVTTDIEGYVGSGSDTIMRVADKDTVETRFKFYCNDFTLALGDLIIYEGATYEVVGQPRNTAHRNHHIKTLIRKVDNIKQDKGV